MNSMAGELFKNLKNTLSRRKVLFLECNKFSSSFVGVGKARFVQLYFAMVSFLDLNVQATRLSCKTSSLSIFFWIILVIIKFYMLFSL